MDADAFLQLAADDGLYTNVAALLTVPSDQLMHAAPDTSFAWSPCTYSLTTGEGAWPRSFSAAAPLSVSMDRLPLATASGWLWHKNHQLPRLTVTCGAAPPLEPLPNAIPATPSRLRTLGPSQPRPAELVAGLPPTHTPTQSQALRTCPTGPPSCSAPSQSTSSRTPHTTPA